MGEKVILNVERANEMARMFDKSTDVIPEGIYCHVGRSTFCPYWGRNPNQEEQNDGYCAFLGKGDWEHDGIGLLWDQVKECGVKDDVEDGEIGDAAP